MPTCLRSPQSCWARTGSAPKMSSKSVRSPGCRARMGRPSSARSERHPRARHLLDQAADATQETRTVLVHDDLRERGCASKRCTPCTDKEAARRRLAIRERGAADPSRAAKERAVGTTLEQVLCLLLDDRDARVASGQGSADTVSFHEAKAGMLLHHLLRPAARDCLALHGSQVHADHRTGLCADQG